MSDSLQPLDCSPPGSSVHGILQARILEWVAVSFSKGSSIFPSIRVFSNESVLPIRWPKYCIFSYLLSKDFLGCKELKSRSCNLWFGQRIITAGEFHSYEWGKKYKNWWAHSTDPRDSNRVLEYSTHHCLKSFETELTLMPQHRAKENNWVNSQTYIH